jgi:hypothetical protein
MHTSNDEVVISVKNDILLMHTSNDEIVISVKNDILPSVVKKRQLLRSRYGMHAGAGPLHPVRHRAPCFLLCVYLNRILAEVKRLVRFFWFFLWGKRGKRVYWEVKEKPQQTAIMIKELVQGPVPYPCRFIGCSAL